ncbi:MAG: ABC transporter C-terminal domain-containing protein, partial [Nocardioides sp.]
TDGRPGVLAGAAPEPVSGSRISGAELRAAQKELAAVERKLEKLQAQVDAAHTALATHDPSDYLGLAAATERITPLEEQLAALEERWYELGEQIG